MFVNDGGRATVGKSNLLDGDSVLSGNVGLPDVAAAKHNGDGLPGRYIVAKGHPDEEPNVTEVIDDGHAVAGSLRLSNCDSKVAGNCGGLDVSAAIPLNGGLSKST